jgi:hypothetical protein
MNHTLAVVGHIRRAEMIDALRQQLDPAYVSIDGGALGCTGNHRRVWRWHAGNTTTQWALILEDDAQPVAGFTDQAEAALSVAPTPIVSFYLGKLYPVENQDRIPAAMDSDSCWILHNRLRHGVAYAVRTELLPSLALHNSPGIVDTASHVTHWAKTHGHTPIGYTNPSLADHADTPTVITHRTPRRQGRTAWHTGTRDHWDESAVTL